MKGEGSEDDIKQSWTEGGSCYEVANVWHCHQQMTQPNELITSEEDAKNNVSTARWLLLVVLDKLL